MSRFALLPIWITVVAAGTYALSAYQLATGEAGTPESLWPNNAHICPHPDKPTLVMFVHPHCPCTRASLSELSILTTQCQGMVQSYVVLVQPRELEEAWVQTDLFEQAKRIAGVSVLRDVDGTLAEQFRVHTSGETLLYDKAGRLRFCGGITQSRGHQGDNVGRQSIVDLVLHGVVRESTTPAYGCPLQNENIN